MVRMYKAGTAYVDVVPVFKDFQRLVAKHLKESLANKDNYKDLEGNLQRSLDKGLDNLDEKLQKQLKEAGLQAMPEGERIGKRVGQGVNKGVAKELTKDNSLKREIRKFGQDIEKDLGAGFMKGAYNSKAAREEIISNLKKISNAYSKEGAKSADEIERSYGRIRKAMESVTKTGTGKGLASKSDLATIEDALKKFEDNQLRIGKGYSRARIAQIEAELKAQKKAADEKIKAERDAAEAERKQRASDSAALRRQVGRDHAAALRDDAEFNRQRERLRREADNEAYRGERMRGMRQSQLIAQQARDQAKARGETAYDRTFATARNEWRQIGADTARGNAKQQRLMESRRQTILAAQRDMNSLLITMSRISSARPTVNLQTGEAKRHLDSLREDLEKAFLKVAEPKRIELHTAVAERSLERLRMAAEDADNIDWEIDIDDERAKMAIADIKRRLADIKDADIDVNVDVDRADLARTVKNINDSLNYVKNADVRVDEKDALRDVAVINSALDAIRDKRIGVDIDEKDAVANISAIRTAMASLKDKEVDIDIDRNGRLTNALSRFEKVATIADRKAGLLAKSIANASVSMNESTQAFRIFNPMVAGLALVGAPAVSAIGSLTAALGGLVSMAPGLIGGASAIGFAFAGLEESMKKYSKAQDAIDTAKAGGKLTKAQETAIANWEGEKDAIGEATIKWIEYTDVLKTSLREIQKGAREGLFPGLQRSIETLLGQYAEPLQDFLRRMGQGLGFVAEQWSNELVGDQAQAWFSRVADDAILYTLNMAEAGANLVRGFGGLVDAFRPFAREFSQYLIDATGRFDDWANSLAGSSKLDSFLDSVRSVSPEIGDLMKNIGEFFVNATIAVEPFSLAVLDALNGALDFVNALDPKVLGAILGAVGGLTGGLMVLSGVVAGAGALAAVLGAALSNPFTMAVTAIGSFIAVNSTALGMVTAMDAAAGDLGLIMGSLGGALETAADFARGFWGAMGHLFEALSPLGAPLSAVISDLVELGGVLGGGLISSIELLATFLGLLIDGFTSLPDWLQESVLMFGLVAGGAIALSRNMGTLQAGIGIVVDSIASIVKGFKDWITNAGLMMANIGETTAQFTGMGGAVKNADGNVSLLKAGLLGLTATVGVLAAVTAGIILMSKAQEEARKNAEEGKKSLESYAQGAAEYGSSVRKGLEDVFDSEWWEGTAGTIEQQMERLANAQKTGDFAGTKVLKQNMKELDETLQGMVSNGHIDQAIVTWQEFAKTARASGVDVSAMTRDHFPGFIESLNRINGELGEVVSEQEIMASIAKGEIPPALLAAMEASGQYSEAIANITGKTDEAEQATRDLIAANDDLSGRFLSQEEANTAYYEAMDKFNEYVKTAKGGIDAQTDAGRKNREEIRKMADAVRSKADADLEASGDVNQYTNTLWSQRKALIEAAKKMGATEEEAGELANTVLKIPRHVDTKAELKDWASDKAKDIQKELAKIKRKINIDVALKYYEDKSKLSDLQKKYPGARIPAPPVKEGYYGGIMEFYANGGLRPMDPVAQMVQPNTWRVVGDRGDVPEAYIPLNGSERSWKIMLEALRMMPGALPFHDGGIAAFAAGAVTRPVAGSPSTPAADAGQAAGDTAIAEAMAALVAALGESWATMLTTMQTQTEAFYAKLLETMAAQNALALTAEQTHFSAMLTAVSQYHSQASAANTSHNSALSSANSSWRSHQLDATSSFMASMLSRTESGDRSIRNEWNSHWGLMSGITSDYRSRESERMSNFLNGTLLGQISSFGRSADRLWSGVWNNLVDSARSIFSALPDSIGNILSSISSKMNTHIVTPYNKVVSDMDLSKKLKLNPFPTQKYRDGGMMQGYTPGRDVHKFFSPTGGILELSGGEPVLRPEAGLVLGSDWVDGVNAAARTQGISGVKKFLGGHQAHADGGFIESQAFANGGQIKKNHAGLIQLGRLLQGLGISVTEHPAFGGVTPGAHSPTGWHPKNGALDLNAGAGTSRAEQAVFDKMIPILWKMGWGVIWRYANHYNHAHVDLGNTALGSFSRNPDTSSDLWKQLLAMKVGPPTGGGGSVDFFDLPGEMDGWLDNAKKAIGTGALPDLMMGVGNKVFSALADAKSNDFMETASFAGADFSSVANGPIKKMAKAMLEKMGWASQFGDLDWLLTRESGWRPTAQNPTSTAYGLFQFLNSTWATVGGRKTSDPRKQLEYGLRYIQQRYGDIRGARAFWQRNHWYKDGTSGIDLSPNPKSNPNGTEGLVAPAAAELDLRPDAIFRDGGGPLPTGYTTVLNNLGHEETILPATPHEVTKSFERLIETGTGEGDITITDSVFRGDPREVAREIHREGRIQRIGRTVKF